MILKNAIATAAENFKGVVGDASKGFFQVGVAADIFGKSALDLVDNSRCVWSKGKRREGCSCRIW